MDHMFGDDELKKTNSSPKLALRDHRIFGDYTSADGQSTKHVDIIIIKGNTKLSDIPDEFQDTVKAEGLF